MNLYAEPELVAEARDAITASGRPVTISVFLSWEWDKWPANVSADLDAWQSAGVDRVCVSLAGPDMETRIETLATWQRAPSR